MPKMPASPRISSGLLSMSYVDARGRKRSAATPVIAAPNLAAIADFFEAKGSMSNAAVERQEQSSMERVLRKNLQAFDEAESSVDTVLVVQWQNDTGDTISDYIPAPDHSILTEDRLQLNLSTSKPAIVQDYIDAMGAVIGAGYTIVRSYIAAYKGRGARAPQLPPSIEEPVSGSQPPAEPALPPAP